MTVIRRGKTTNERLTQVQTPRGLSDVPDLLKEMDNYVRVLLGDEDPPWNNGLLTLQEVAYAYFSRASEIEGLILRAERDGQLPRGAPLVKFRTGELQSYLAIFKEATRLGSRRLAYADYEQRERNA